MLNNVKKKLDLQLPVLGTFFEMGSATAMECLGIAGLDFVIIDGEHGPFESETVLELVRAAELHGLTPFARVKEISRSAILKALETGAQGLIIPCVETVDEVRRIVEYGKYIPVGNRGCFFGRTAQFGYAPYAQGMNTYFSHINEQVMIIPQCETKGALEHIEEIVRIDGVDGIFIGPYDLSIAIGKPEQWQDPVFLAAIARVLQACKDAQKPCFMFAGTAEKARAYIAQGFEGIALNTDAAIFIQTFQNMVRQVREG